MQHHVPRTERDDVMRRHRRERRVDDDGDIPRAAKHRRQPHRARPAWPLWVDDERIDATRAKRLLEIRHRSSLEHRMPPGSDDPERLEQPIGKERHDAHTVMSRPARELRQTTC